MAIHWKIPFKSRRSGTVYTVNIYDANFSGTAVVLKPGASPFSTQEDDDEDMFKPVRTQTGYIRIVDDGKDASGNTLGSGDDWKALVPETDTDRPVTLTHVSGSSTVVDWAGFMQAQDFGATLYGNPQERAFPVQCVLTVTESTDINYQQKEMQNFAYLLKQIVDSIPETCRPTSFVVQGGSDAQALLLKMIDWQNFVGEDSQGNPSPRYNMFSLLEDMCRFFGWTARTYKRILYMTCADDAAATTLLTMTYAQLTTMAGGTAAGSTTGTLSNVTVSGDVFASVMNEDFLQRGVSRAIVSADAGSLEGNIMELPGALIRAMLESGTTGSGGGSFGNAGSQVHVSYSADVTSIDTAFLAGSCRSGYGSVNMMTTYPEGGSSETFGVFRIKKSYSSGATTPHIGLQTVYHHCFSGTLLPRGMGGVRLMISGKIYRQGSRFKDANDADIGQKKMYLRVGIGPTRASAVWYNPSVTNDWTSTLSEFSVLIGQESEELANIRCPESAYGLLFVDFLGSDDLPLIDGERGFEIADFVVEVTKELGYYTYQQRGGGRYASYHSKDANDKIEYVSTNNSRSSDSWHVDCIFASDSDTVFGSGVLMNPDGTSMKGFCYNGGSLMVHPEKHLTDRVASYWNVNKRRLQLELRTNAVSEISPKAKVTADGTTCCPLSIGREWRDDVLKVTLLEL